MQAAYIEWRLSTVLLQGRGQPLFMGFLCFDVAEGRFHLGSALFFSKETRALPFHFVYDRHQLFLGHVRRGGENGVELFFIILV